MSSPNPADDKQVLHASHRKALGSVCFTPPLFNTDPEENFKLWIHNCFPDAPSSRDDAIRQWLARPAELRAHGTLDENRTSAPASSEERKEPPPSQMNANNTGTPSERNPLTYAAATSPQLRRPIPGPKQLPRLVRYVVLTVVMTYLIWAAPTSSISSHTKSTIDSFRSSSADSAVSGLTLEAEKGNNSGFLFASSQIMIDSISLGCEAAQPCIEIRTRGGEIIPRLTALTGLDRLVIDFGGADYRSGIRPITLERGAVKSVRIQKSAGELSPGSSVVVDLAMKCNYELQAFANLLVVKVYPDGTLKRPE